MWIHLCNLVLQTTGVQPNQHPIRSYLQLWTCLGVTIARARATVWKQQWLLLKMLVYLLQRQIDQNWKVYLTKRRTKTEGWKRRFELPTISAGACVLLLLIWLVEVSPRWTACPPNSFQGRLPWLCVTNNLSKKAKETACLYSSLVVGVVIMTLVRQEQRRNQCEERKSQQKEEFGMVGWVNNSDQCLFPVSYQQSMLVSSNHDHHLP